MSGGPAGLDAGVGAVCVRLQTGGARTAPLPKVSRRCAALKPVGKCGHPLSLGSGGPCPLKPLARLSFFSRLSSLLLLEMGMKLSGLRNLNHISQLWGSFTSSL